MSLLKSFLMSQNKIMYATIKGTLTENDGVFSGFSDSNYLALQNSFKLNANTVAEFKFKLNLTSVTTVSGILSTPNNYGMQFVCANDSKLTLYLGNNSSWTILSAKKGTTLLQANTNYYIRLLIDKGTITLLLSTDDITYTTEFTAVVTIPEEYTYNLGYGRGRATTQYLRGSIDLPNSYIKLGSTKYKLQAVVGYTIVGSLTESPSGVFSGFVSQTNYLSLPNLTVSQIGEDSIFFARFKIPSGTFFPIFNSAGGNSLLWINITAQNKIVLKIGNSDFYRTNNTLDFDFSQYHTIKVVFKNYKVSIFIDNILFEEYQFSTPTNLTNSRAIWLGNEGWTYGTGHTYPNCYIDLNNNYIKLANKLWFNGQEG